MIKNPKIAFMTTLGVNVGDDFIREGICSLLDEIFEEWTPFYVNKVDLATLYEHREDETSVIEDKFRDADIIIQAGAPVYWRIGTSTSYSVAWAEELWKMRIFQLGPEKPILNLAAGACQPYPDFARTFLADPECVEFARNISRACRWTSVRDPLASQILCALEIEHDVLPCTAFHAARRTNFKGTWNRVIGFNLMPSGGHWAFDECIDEDAWTCTIESFLNMVRKRWKPLFIAHDSSEILFMERFRKAGEVIFYSPHWRDYLAVYAKCASVVSNRVHGAVCASGFGRPSIIIGNDTRLLIGDYIDIPSLYITNVRAERLVDLLESGLANRADEEERLLSLREETAERYREAILENLGKRPLNCTVKLSRQSDWNLKQGKRAVKLASTKELSSRKFRNFMFVMNCFAQRWGLHQFIDWSKIWEYPWLWFNALSGKDWMNLKVLDIGSELSPMPWFLAGLGAKTTLIETDSHWIPAWEQLRQRTGLNVDWHIVAEEQLPFPALTFDVVTSFSVIEHQADKRLAIDEVTRVLKPGGTFALSFDICEPAMGMSFPEWNGRALMMKEFEELIWKNPEFSGSSGSSDRIAWNVEDCAAFIEWNLKSAPHHNYTVGAAVFHKSPGK